MNVFRAEPDMFSYKFFMLNVTATALSIICVSCATIDPEGQSDSTGMLIGAGVPVPAAGETQAVATSAADAADDPEIWVDPANPDRAVIFGTDKKAGLYVYNLDGTIRTFLPEGRLNNVDLRTGFPTPQGERVLVAATHRDKGAAALFLFDPATMETSPWGLAPLAMGEPYGLCMGRRGDDFIVVANDPQGQVRQLRVSAGPDGAVQSVEERRFKVATQPEGCVIDDVRGLLYLGEEMKGIWRYPLDGAPVGTLIAAAPSEMLTPDVEGLTLLREGPVTWLIASSQGDSAFAVWRVDAGEPQYKGRFSVVAANGVDPVTGTDGVAAHGGRVGRFAEGLVVMQDDVDSDGEAAALEGTRQNYKLVDWAEVKKALGL